MPGRFDPTQYDDVNTRIARFWGDHPGGAIHTELLSSPNEVKSVVVRATVFFDILEPMPRGVGLAQENAGGSGANSTSWLENAETSAIGRALANCGYSGTKRPSQQEMEKTERPTARYAPGPQQQSPAPPRQAGPSRPAPDRGEDGEIRPCYNCRRPVRLGTLDGRQGRFNADGGLHDRTCKAGTPTGYEAVNGAAEGPAGDMDADPFAEDAGYAGAGRNGR